LFLLGNNNSGDSDGQLTYARSNGNSEIGFAGRTVQCANNLNASAYSGLLFTIHGDMLSNQNIWDNLIHKNIKN